MSALREIAAKIGFEVKGKKELKEADKLLNELTDKVKGLATFAALWEGMKGVAGFVAEQVEVGKKIGLWADRLGVTREEFQQMDYAAQQAGVSTDQFTLAMKLFGKHVGDAEEHTKTATKLFGQLGMEVLDATGKAKPMPELLGELADHFQKNDSWARRSADALHLMGKGGAYMIPFLRQGRAAVEEAMRGLKAFGGGLRDEVIDNAMRAGRQLKAFEYGLKVVKSELANGFYIILNNVAGKITDFIGSMIEFTRVTTFTESAWYALGVAAVAAGVAAIAAWWPVIAPILLIAGAALLAYLAFDDFYALMNGNKSVIGQWLVEAYGMEEATRIVKGLREGWKEFIKFLSDVGIPLLRELGGAVLGVVVKGIQLVGAAIAAVAPYVREFIAELAALHDANDAYFQKRKEGKGILDALTGTGGYLDDLLSANGKANQKLGKKQLEIWGHNLNGTPSPAPADLAGPPTPYGMGNQVARTQVQVYSPNIHINGAKEPKEVAEEIDNKAPFHDSDPIADADYAAWGM